jgi:hypothetical protein
MTKSRNQGIEHSRHLVSAGTVTSLDPVVCRAGFSYLFATNGLDGA